MRNIVRYSVIVLFLCFVTKVFAKENLSLHEAILLAVRSNPNVQTADLDHVLQKFNTHLQEWEFSPHYSFEATASTGRTWVPDQQVYGSHNYSAQPGVTWNSKVGTTTSLSATNSNSGGHYNPGLSLQIMQPLMRGFGRAVVEAALNDARDSEIISRLNIEGTLRNIVSQVINAYLDVIAAEKRITISEEAVQRAERSVMQTKLYIKAGRKAGNELVTVEANVASAKAALANDKNNLLQARYALLAAIGIDPNTDIYFTGLDVNQLIHRYAWPTLQDTKKLTLKNDIQYQVDNIILHGQIKRNIVVAEDRTRWELNLVANANTGNGTGGGLNAGVNSLFNGANQSHSVGLVLNIPIDDQASKQAVLSAKIALKRAELAFTQKKWAIETNAINTWNSVSSAKQTLSFAEDAERLQKKTYNISYQKYLHGLIDSLELQSAQLQLIQAEQSLLAARINYIKALVNLDYLMGHTLTTWHIKVRL
jgi:outer membrane protein TolC